MLITYWFKHIQFRKESQKLTGLQALGQGYYITTFLSDILPSKVKAARRVRNAPLPKHTVSRDTSILILCSMEPTYTWVHACKSPLHISCSLHQVCLGPLWTPAPALWQLPLAHQWQHGATQSNHPAHHGTHTTTCTSAHTLHLRIWCL